MKDIFSESGNPNDKSLGNDFIDLDDPNGNQDFSEQEQTIAADGFNQEPGNIDKGIVHDDNVQNDYNFDDSDFIDNDNLDPDLFLTDNASQTFDSIAAKEKKTEIPVNTGSSENDLQYLETVNKKFKTNFKTEKEFNDFLTKTNEQQFNEETIISDKDQQLYDRNAGSINYLSQLLQKEDEDLVREHHIISFAQKNKRKPESEDLELIESQIERMKDNMVLELNASTYRTKYSQQKQELESFNGKIDEKINQATSAKQKQNQQRLLNNYKNIYLSEEGNFMGAKISTTDLQEAFNDVKSGEFVKRILSNPELAARLSLIERKYEDIKRITSQPGYSDGISAILRNNNDGKRMGSNARQSQASSGRNTISKDEAFLM